MNEKELSEIRRRLRPDKNNIAHIHGCYVNEKREVISLFSQPFMLMPKEESEAYLSLFKRTLSGTVHKNLLDISFDTKQVMGSEEHTLLMALKNSALKDENAVQAFYERVVQNVSLDGNYLILLTHDIYDVPYRSSDGERQNDASNEVFSYVLCSICPVKVAKPSLRYYISENEFHNRETGWIVSAPEMGFMFPTFDDRRTNIYNAMYYTRDTESSHTDFVEAVFRTEAPVPAGVQKTTFQSILSNALEEDCNYEVVQAIHEQLCERIEEHKVNKEVPMEITKNDVRKALAVCGVPPQRIEAFDERYDAEFGADTNLSPKNIVDSKQFEIRTPDVMIRVSPERSDLIETRIINGTKYILLCADEGVEVNGVNIHFPDEA